MNYFRICPYCGIHLDPGEICDCQKEKTVASAANTDNGVAGYGFKPQIPATIITENYGGFKSENKGKLYHGRRSGSP